MCEIVSLNEYRAALAVIRTRERERRWRGLRFKDIDYLDYFMVPSFSGGKGDIYIKTGPESACIWSTAGGQVVWSYYATNHATSFYFGLPIQTCPSEMVPPG